MQIVYAPAVESTQDLAMAAAHGGAAPGTVFLADLQTHGRGRRVVGELRRWHAPSGSSILMSIIVRPALDVAQSAMITLAAGVAAAEVLRGRAGLDVQLKWPNDLFVGGRKLGGILAEGCVDDGRLSAVIVGCGINVNLDLAELPEEVRAGATSLSAEAGRSFDRLDLLTHLVPAIVEAAERIADPATRPAMLSRWEALSAMTGREVTFSAQGQTRAGVARGLEPDGALRVELADGTLTAIRAGEVVFGEPKGADVLPVV